jgi:hypothetical protein
MRVSISQIHSRLIALDEFGRKHLLGVVCLKVTTEFHQGVQNVFGFNDVVDVFLRAVMDTAKLDRVRGVCVVPVFDDVEAEVGVTFTRVFRGKGDFVSEE